MIKITSDWASQNPATEMALNIPDCPISQALQVFSIHQVAVRNAWWRNSVTIDSQKDLTKSNSTQESETTPQKNSLSVETSSPSATTPWTQKIPPQSQTFAKPNERKLNNDSATNGCSTLFELLIISDEMITWTCGEKIERINRNTTDPKNQTFNSEFRTVFKFEKCTIFERKTIRCRQRILFSVTGILFECLL